VQSLPRQVFVLFTAASCATGTGTVPVAPEATPSSSASAAEQIYKVVLDTTIGRHSVAVIPDSTSGNWNAEGLQAGAPPGFEDVSLALAGPPQAVTPPLSLSRRMIPVSRATFGALAHGTLSSLHDQFGSNAVLMRLSRLGVSGDSTRAVVATDAWRGGDSVISELLFLARSADGRWQVVKRDRLYIEQ
jgi:hypothetical protein